MTAPAPRRLLTLLAPALGLVAVAQGPPAPVVDAAVERALLAPERAFSGTVEPVRRVRVGSEVEGKVEELHVRRGDRVERGALLCRLRAVDAELLLAEARAERQLRHDELQELRNGTRPSEIESARARLRAAEAEELYRVWSLGRAEPLASGNAVSEDVLQQARLEEKRSRAARADAAAALALLEEGPRAERIAQAEARLATQDQVVARLVDAVARHDVRAPFAGWVAEEWTEAGAWIARGAAVVEIVDLDPVEVVVPVTEDWIANVVVGATARVELDAFPGETFAGSVRSIVPQADVASRTFPVRVTVENARTEGQPRLRAGLFARVRLSVGAERSVLLVPKDAIVMGGPEPGVYVVEAAAQGAPPTARWVPVVVGEASGHRVAVEGALAEGSRVVVRGNERLRPGQPLQVANVADAR